MTTVTAIPRFTGDAEPVRRRRPVRRLPHRRTSPSPSSPTSPTGGWARASSPPTTSSSPSARTCCVPERRRVRPRALRPQGQDHGRLGDPPPPRRRRAEHPYPTAEDHDWALVRLGAPGVIRGIVVDTAHFRGNYPQAVSRRGAPAVAGLPVAGGTPRRRREVDDARPAHGRRRPRGQRLRRRRRAALHPSARQPAPRRRHRPPAGVRRGRPRPGVAGRARHLRRRRAGERRPGRGRLRPLLLPAHATPSSRAAPARWTTAGRPAAAATQGNDWIRYRLAAQSEIRAVEIDTAYLKGNCGGLGGAVRCSDGEDGEWTRAPAPHPPPARHRTTASCSPAPAVATHVRIDIFPDGGISRLRLHGSLTEEGAPPARRPPRRAERLTAARRLLPARPEPPAASTAAGRQEPPAGPDQSATEFQNMSSYAWRRRP